MQLSLAAWNPLASELLGSEVTVILMFEESLTVCSTVCMGLHVRWGGAGEPIGQMCQCRLQTMVPKVKGEEGPLFPHSGLCV